MTPPPPPHPHVGFRFWKDQLDGFTFLYPSDWINVTARAITSHSSSQPQTAIVAGRARAPPPTPPPTLRRTAVCVAAFTQTAGADVFFRDPLSVEETVFVDVRTPPPPVRARARHRSTAAAPALPPPPPPPPR